MSCLSGVQGWLCGAGKAVSSTAAEPNGKVTWSQVPSAAAKVQLDVVWEVPQGTDAKTVPARPDFAVAKYSKIKPLNAALLDSYINGYQRTTTLFFGRIVSNPDDTPAFQEPLGYNMTYNAMATGNGNALHRHNSVEIFVALDAPFEIAYGSQGEYKALLQPWDLVACPAEAIHSYKNMGQDGGQIMTFLCGKPAITWAPGVVDEARKNGAVCDDSGILLAHAPAKKSPVMSFQADTSMISRQTTGESVATQATAASDTDLADAAKRRAALQGLEADELVLGAGALDKFVYRYSERASRHLKVGSSAGTMHVHWADLAPGRCLAPEGDEDTLVIVLGGSVICQDRQYTHLDVLKQPTFMTAGAEGATLLVTRSTLPHNLNFFFDADITA
eukprot:gb/GFBE01000111.1/.p1 GENE.gb/GFBE01000111.1/~~gb/GFBE01000111.1/.p1  ORF type:complete len:389 (+),score=109.25 gb/GFBE01000111.1/:1-1167(+)